MAFENTLAALKVYDEGATDREAAWHNVLNDADVNAADRADKAAALKVQVAFHHDTAPLNHIENCTFININYIRYVATGRPDPSSINIGNVWFGRLTGKTTRQGTPEWIDSGHMGETRVALLRAVRDGEPLPDGLILVGSLGSPCVPIPAEAVRWESSGVGPSEMGVDKRYKVKVTRSERTTESDPLSLADARTIGRCEAPTAEAVTIIGKDRGCFRLHQIIK